MLFRIRGVNLYKPGEQLPEVLIGNRSLTVQDAAADHLLVLTPDDLPTNVEMQLVVRRAGLTSVVSTN